MDKGHTSFPRKRGWILSCELIWKASSKSGDYHDNMNSKMFMLWVTQKLVPTFERLHPSKTMVLVCDNAAYHHSRELGSLGGKTKSELVEICEKYNIHFVDLPFNENRYDMLEEGNGDEDMITGITDIGDFCRVSFDSDLFKEKANSNNPFVPTTEELKEAMVRYIAEYIPALLECKVERYLSDRGHTVMWTPPYTPDLQPIELFWAAGKNHAAYMSYAGITMKEVVQHLREGWYGNLTQMEREDLPQHKYDSLIKKPADCSALFRHAIDCANKRFVPMCAGISGEIGSLVIDKNHIANKEGLPIDMFVLDITDGVELCEKNEEIIEIIPIVDDGENRESRNFFDSDENIEKIVYQQPSEV